MTAFAIIEAVPLRAELIEEAALAVRKGAPKRKAGIAVYDRFFASRFEEDDQERREDRLRHISKLIRNRIKQVEEKSQL